MARKYVRLASPIKKMVRGIGEIIGALIPVFDYVKSRTSPVGSIPDEVGVESWSAEDRTLQLNLGNDVFYTYGGEIFVDVENKTGAQIDNGSLVMFGSTVGASGNVLAVLAITDGTFPAEYLIGSATENIADNASDGKVTWFGKVRGVDTSAWAKGTILYSDPTVPGGYTDTKPEAPNIKSTIALVLSSNASGILLVRPNLLGKLSDLHDVEITNPANLETIAYNTALGRFENTNAFLPRSAWNGTFVESFNCLPSSDGATITVSLEKSGGGDLTMQFSDGLTTLDCTPACTATLTAGSATVYQKNYIYIPIATKLLTVSTTGWPATEHIKVSFQCVFTATAVQTEDAFIHQDWNDELADTVGMGHITHIGQLLREGRGWFSGADGAGTSGYLTIGVGTATVQSTAAVIKQTHTHNYLAKNTATGDDIHVVNDPTTPYLEITDLTSLTQDSTGGSLDGKYFNIVLAGTANKTGQYSPLLLLLPSGSYNNTTRAQQDLDGFTSTALPREFTKDSSNGFLIVRITVRLSGGNITYVTEKDLRGTDSGAGGAGNAAPTVFTGELLAYSEGEITPVFTAGALSIDYGANTTANIIELPALTQNSVVTFTGTLTQNKPITLSTIPDTGGPWTLSVTANGKTKLLTRNGGGTATEELFLIRSNGTDLRHADGGGVVWSEGV